METAEGEDRVAELIRRYGALIGEVTWHNLTVDDTIQQISRQHFEEVLDVLRKHPVSSPARRKVLEVASYAHVTGYGLAESLNADVTLFDISSNTLKLGRRCAGRGEEISNPRLVTGDFHSLPFEDESFDFVFIYSALHHTYDWPTVLSEMQRVLKQGGLLFLGNEPVHRACCFYRFRTNRMNDFTPFEQKLDELGMIRTVAEPYLGSRAETLYGMVENQMIPLSDFVARLAAETPILDISFSPEICIGRVEKSWLDRAPLGGAALERAIREDLRGAFREAGSALDEIAAGLGFGIPDPGEVERMAEDIAGRIAELPPPAEDVLYRANLCEIFGGAVRVIAGKPMGDGSPPDRDFDKTYERCDGIFVAFDDEIRPLLVHDDSVFPDIQSSDAGALERSYDPGEWTLFRSDGQCSRLTLARQPGRIALPRIEEPRVLIANVFLSKLDVPPCRLSIRQGGHEIYARTLWRPEPFLCAAEVGATTVPESRRLEVRCNVVDGAGGRAALDGALHLRQARLVRVPRGCGALDVRVFVASP